MGKSLISGDEYIKAVLFGNSQEVAVSESVPTFIGGSEDVMRAEVVT